MPRLPQSCDKSEKITAHYFLLSYYYLFYMLELELGSRSCTLCTLKYTSHARTDVPSRASFTVSQSAARSVLCPALCDTCTRDTLLYREGKGSSRRAGTEQPAQSRATFTSNL